MNKKKIQKYRDAVNTVRSLKAKFKQQEANFQCVKNRNLVCAGDPCESNGNELKRCDKYDINMHCPYLGCPHYDWNTTHYRTYIDLCNAKMNRFLAFVNLFKRSK